MADAGHEAQAFEEEGGEVCVFLEGAPVVRVGEGLEEVGEVMGGGEEVVG